MRRQRARAGLPPALERGFPAPAAGGRFRASAERFRRGPAHPGSPRAAIGCPAGARRVKGRARAGYKAAKVTARAGARGPPGIPSAARARDLRRRPGAMEGVSALLASYPTAGLAGGLGITACAAAGVLLYRIARR